ncbi:MAG: hypothetical protein AVDCRST_MAG12-1658, partial [uncultured Rubrobacteraceae bacterium]
CRGRSRRCGPGPPISAPCCPCWRRRPGGWPRGGYASGGRAPTPANGSGTGSGAGRCTCSCWAGGPSGPWCSSGPTRRPGGTCWTTPVTCTGLRSAATRPARGWVESSSVGPRPASRTRARRTCGSIAPRGTGRSTITTRGRGSVTAGGRTFAGWRCPCTRRRSVPRPKD